MLFRSRHFAILENEVWGAGYHDGDRDIQESVHTDYDPEWFTLNGRCWPDTPKPNDRPATSPWPPPAPPAQSSGITTPNPNYSMAPDKSQPNSALIQANAGERVLLRLANLGYRQNAMQLPGIPMHVVGQDASRLDTPYWTDTLYIGPGEARDVLFDAPPHDGSADPYNVYHFKNRDWRKLSNNGASGPGGMMTEVRIYPTGTLGAQTVVSQVF